MLDFKNMNIMVVDDDIPTREKIIQDLRGLGFAGIIYEATDGQNAFDTIRNLESGNKDLDLVICDIVMPIKNGVEFLQELRKSDSKFKDIKFLMLTSKSDRTLVVTCIKLGVAQYLIKPWDKKNLMLKMMEIKET